MKTTTTYLLGCRKLLVSILLIAGGLHGITQVIHTDITMLNTALNGTLLLNLNTSSIDFEFTTFAEYQQGMGSHLGPYFTEGSIAATTNWELSFKAAEPFLHSDGVTTMPLDNVGVTVEWTGYNKIKNYAKTHAKALEMSEVLLIGQSGNKSNAGDESANSFVLYWQMGTGDGNMQSQSLFDQNLKKGPYSTSVAFVVSEVL
ncbi:MAG: hypothetical protein WC151_06765 [Bacteroidales bacterium]|nr:hypothetical protein [Bacteroidales bacterium]HPE87732.1 hypothetical protein [Bacteroidales bacterium]